MKDIFQSFFNFFRAAPQKERRQADQADRRGQGIGQKLPQREDPGAERQKIEDRAAEQGQQNIKAHLAPGGGNDVEKQGGGDRRPEQQVQHRAKHAPAQAAAQQTQQVVQRAHPQPQGDRAGQGGGLTGHGDLHLSAKAGRKSRPFPAPGPRRSGNLPCPPPSDLPRPG